MLVHMHGAEFSLAGVELAAGDGRRMVEAAQVWRWTVVAAESLR